MAKTKKDKPGKRLKLKGAGASSVKEMKRALKRGSGGGYLKRIPGDGLTVRFLEEPDQWLKFFEHYDEGREDDRYFPCVEGDCVGCDESLRAQKRWLTNALDVSENRVIPLVLPASLVSNLLKKYDKFKTMLDRDYELTKEGTGFDTEYDALYDGPSPMKVSRYKDQHQDLEALLLGILERASAEKDDDDDDKPKKRAKGNVKSKSKKSEPDDDSKPAKRIKAKPSKSISQKKPLNKKSGGKSLGKKK